LFCQQLIGLSESAGEMRVLSSILLNRAEGWVLKMWFDNAALYRNLFMYEFQWVEKIKGETRDAQFRAK
jgi:hypothetical protein